MGLLDRLKELDTAVLVALALGIAVVGLVLLVVLAVVLAAVIGSFVLGVGEAGESASVEGGEVAADASLQPDAEASAVTVVWTSNADADHLLVEWTASDGDVRATDTVGDASYEDGAVRLTSVGSSVTLAAADDAGEVTVQVTVTAVGDAGRTVVVDRSVSV